LISFLLHISKVATSLTKINFVNFTSTHSSLTVIPSKSNSCMKMWEATTDNIIREISNNTNNVVFILWGNYAKSKIKYIDQNRHLIITEGISFTNII